MSVVSQYIEQTNKLGQVVVPLEAISESLKAAGKSTFEEIVGYSIVLCTSEGKLAGKIGEDLLAFMPHVIARGDATKEAATMMHKAGFINDGFCKGRPSLELRLKEAQVLLDRLISAGGFPGVTQVAEVQVVAPVKKSRTKKTAVATVAPAEEKEAPSDEK